MKETCKITGIKDIVDIAWTHAEGSSIERFLNIVCYEKAEGVVVIKNDHAKVFVRSKSGELKSRILLLKSNKDPNDKITDPKDQIIQELLTITGYKTTILPFSEDELNGVAQRLPYQKVPEEQLVDEMIAARGHYHGNTNYPHQQ